MLTLDQPNAHTNAHQRTKRYRSMARAAGQDTNLSPTDWLFALRWWFETCAYCRAKAADLPERLTLDHFQPKNSGGPIADALNVLPCCDSCNQSKGEQKPAVWMHKTFGEAKANRRLRRINRYFSIVEKRKEQNR